MKMKYVKDITIGFCVACIIIFAIIGICSVVSMSDTSTPIEGNDVIDSLTTANDSIKIKVEHLDSIKNVKVVEVLSLDNDSTVKLFYELVSE